MVIRGFVSKWKIIVLGAMAIASASQSSVHAQFGNQFFRPVGVVGGVSINADGLVRDANLQEKNEALADLRKQFRGASGPLETSTERRMISLKAVQAAIEESIRSGKPLSEEMMFLGGLTRIDYIFVYPEQNDIVIAGPAENWIVSEQGSIVGQRSGNPVIYLDDLACAFQSVHRNASEGVSCSIDPTPEGSRRLNALLGTVKLGPGADARQLEPAMREAFGPQDVRLTGVPTNSHMARVLLAADYQMKRYGMNLTEAPVKGLPSYIEMIRNRHGANQSRWWMACSYDALEQSSDSLAWKLSGKRIQTLTEQEQIDRGDRKQTGKQDAMAKKWADLFTQKMDELVVNAPVFGELRNCMDLCVLSALIDAKDLESLAGCDLSVLRGRKQKVELSDLGTPKTLPAQCSFLKTGNGWMATASGGVSIDAWTVIQRSQTSDAVSQVRSSSKNDRNAWAWN